MTVTYRTFNEGRCRDVEVEQSAVPEPSQTIWIDGQRFRRLGDIEWFVETRPERVTAVVTIMPMPKG